MKLQNAVASSYLVMTNVTPEEWCAVVTEQRQIIGRAPDSDVRVSPRFRHVSRRHAEIWRDRQHVKIRDLGSQAGTHVNGVWVKDSAEATVAVGDRIWMGGLELELVDQVNTLAKLLAETKISMDEEADAEDTVDTMITAPIPTRFTLASLTQAELEILLWMSRGYLDDTEIGKTLHRSPNTIRTQVSSISKKLNVHSRGEIVAWLKRGN